MIANVIVGIDPGVKTGIALWHTTDRKLIAVETCNIIEATVKVVMLHEAGILRRMVFEDARLRRSGWARRDCDDL